MNGVSVPDRTTKRKKKWGAKSLVRRLLDGAGPMKWSSPRAGQVDEKNQDTPAARDHQTVNFRDLAILACVKFEN